MKKLLAACAAVFVIACVDAPVAPETSAEPPVKPAQFDSTFTCRSGYVIAYNEQGEPYCAPEGGSFGGSQSGGGEP